MLVPFSRRKAMKQLVEAVMINQMGLQSEVVYTLKYLVFRDESNGEKIGDTPFKYTPRNFEKSPKNPKNDCF